MTAVRASAIQAQGADRICHLARRLGCDRRRVYNIESLAACEAYRVRHQDGPPGRENDAMVGETRFIRKEGRAFVRLASAPHAPLVRP